MASLSSSAGQQQLHCKMHIQKILFGLEKKEWFGWNKGKLVESKYHKVKERESLYDDEDKSSQAK